MNELAQNIFYRLSTYTVWNDLDSQVKDLLMEAINIGVDETPEQVSVEPEFKPANNGHKCESCGKPLSHYCDNCQKLWES